MIDSINCLLSFTSEQEGGRKMPIGDGFSPILRFEGSFDSFFGKIVLEDEDDVVFPGERIKSKIIFSKQNITSLPALYAGLGFDLFEGEQKIGEGTILSAN